MHTKRWIAVAIFLACSATALAIKVSPPPPREYVTQTWVAFSTNDYYSMRFLLRPDGTGSGVLLRTHQSPEPFKVTSWEYSGSSLALSVHFQNAEIGISGFDGQFKHHLLSYTSSMLPHPERLSAGWLPGPLELTLQGDSNVRFSAWPEQDLEATLKTLKDQPIQ